MKVLVTGGAGFIGSHVVEALVARGDRVEIADDLSSGKRENVPAAARLHVVDIRSPEAAALVRDGGFDAIVHLAAQMDVRRSVADPIFDASVNVLGTLNLLEALRATERATATRFVFSSTGGALYGDFTAPPNAETFSKDPEAPYGIAKLSVEYYMAYYGRVHGMRPVALRFGNVYGPRQDPHGEAGVVAIFCGRILDGTPLTIFGDGEQTRDYVYVGDVAAAVLRAIEADLPPAGQLDARGFNIGTSVPTSVNVLAEQLLRVAGRNVAVQHAPARPGEMQQSFLDVSKAERLLGWRPAVSLPDGLGRTFRWFAERRSPVTA
jgi:UDP-glucose 4-epimerase